MANARGKAIDNTDLSIDQAEARGFIHRDYIAHCLRWTHVAKYLHLRGRFAVADVIDIGCGKDMPLARMLMTSRIAPRSYLGIEYNKFEMPEMFAKTKFKPNIATGIDFTDMKEIPYEQNLPGGLSKFNYSTCFEVLEHVEPAKCIAILDHLPNFLRPCSISWFSTPCYDEKVGAAKNHVNEMTYECFGSLLEEMGYKIHNHWGTFASIKDYKDQLTTPQEEMFKELREYYDSNYLSTIFAPLFPAYSRNCLWETEYVGKLTLEERQFPAIKTLEGVLGSSEYWREITKCVECVAESQRAMNE